MGWLVTEEEGRNLAVIWKKGEPRDQWHQDRPSTFVNAFGVVDEQGKTIPGLQVEAIVWVSPVLRQEKFVFTLFKVGDGRPQRAYQMEINLRSGVKPQDHSYSHEHFGKVRYPADQEWARANFNDALKIFCKKCNLTLDGKMPDYSEFKLS